MKKTVCWLLVLCFLLVPFAVSAENQGEDDDLDDPDNMIYIPGDVNLNGRLDVIDYLLLKRYALEQLELSKIQIRVADIVPDGMINAKDYLLLKRTILAS